MLVCFPVVFLSCWLNSPVGCSCRPHGVALFISVIGRCVSFVAFLQRCEAVPKYVLCCGARLILFSVRVLPSRSRFPKPFRHSTRNPCVSRCCSTVCGHGFSGWWGFVGGGVVFDANHPVAAGLAGRFSRRMAGAVGCGARRASFERGFAGRGKCLRSPCGAGGVG